MEGGGGRWREVEVSGTRIGKPTIGTLNANQTAQRPRAMRRLFRQCSISNRCFSASLRPIGHYHKLFEEKRRRRWGRREGGKEGVRRWEKQREVQIGISYS